MSDSDAIRSLLSRYCHTIDDAAAEEWAALFAPDGTFALPGLGSVTGRSNLVTFATKLSGVLAEFGVGVKHLTVNSVIDATGADATAESDFVVLSRAEGVWSTMGAGRYSDRLTRSEGAWRFSHRAANWYAGEVPAALAAAVRPIIEEVGTVEAGQ